MLEALLKEPACKLIGVVTQPDRPVGRKQELHESPVKIIAKQHGLPVLQPESLKNIELPASDLQVVCQYGLIIPERIVRAPRYGTLNVHTSLLPFYRGASPIQSALIAGEIETGVTIMLMDAKMDHGPLLAQEGISISPDDTTPTLTTKMIPVAQHLLINALKKWTANTLVPVEQKHSNATFCYQFTRQDGELDLSLPAETLYNRFRGLFPWPGSYVTTSQGQIKLLDIRLSMIEKPVPSGTWYVENKRLYLGTITEPLEIITLQRAGGRIVSAEAFLSGLRDLHTLSIIPTKKEGSLRPS